MFNRLKANATNRHTARSLYGAVVAQSRTTELYSVLGVPDTPEGRYEAVVLHLSLVLERLAREGEVGRQLAQVLSETFVTDMDDNMREMGVGDLAVPAKVKRAAAGLYERAADYRAALAADATGGRLQERVAAACGNANARSAEAAALAAYVRAAAAAMSATPSRNVLAGTIAFAPVTG